MLFWFSRSPTSATSFAAVTEDGKLQLWDISYSTVNPKSEWKVPVDQSKVYKVKDARL